MSTPPFPEIVLSSRGDQQTLLPLGSEGVLRWVWEHRYGSMLIEVIGDDVFVNGQRIESHGQ